MLLALAGAALCVLLIALQQSGESVARARLSRQKELAVRTALGAGRERLIRQLVTESMVLSLVGGLLGVLLAKLALPLLTKLVPSLPVAGMPSIDVRVLGFAAVLTVLTGIGFGIVPALRVCRNGDLNGLREGSRSGGGRKAGLRSALIIAEVTLSVVLLISAGLLLRALLKIQSVDPGFRSDGVITLETALPMPKYEPAAKRTAFYRRVLSEIQALPGVSDAAYISFLAHDDGTAASGPWTWMGKRSIVPRAIPPVCGILRPGSSPLEESPCTRAGTSASPTRPGLRWSPSSVNRSRAVTGPVKVPLGRHFKFAFFDRTVVGVVGDIRVRGLEKNSEPQVYLPYQQSAGWLPGILRSQRPGDPGLGKSAAPVARLCGVSSSNADPEQPISRRSDAV